ncbi:PREDICTED: uncharacterized protein LOC104728619 [Camelina sativa]|uniref:Uncharacterized protein LOC104728619 n=1 Tax=Camelina sativa TaxID=90675 RepID=A0ABM0UT33_CAMSA|nr:PREDICTED: uncharacterized protein LOC104728619 [Camelina sativa]
MERYLTEDPPTLPQGATNVYVVGNFITLWLALENKYKTDESGMQKFSNTKFLNFKMVDPKPIMEQVEALQRIFLEIELEEMSICNVFKMNCLIEKLPPGWSDFKHYLNFKRAQNQGHDVHVVEHKAKLKGKGNRIFIPHNTLKASSATNFKKSNLERKFKGKCHHCGKIGHQAEVCKSKTKDLKIQAYLTKEDMDYVHHLSANKQLFVGNTAVIRLKNVKHVPDMRKNLISGTMLSKNGFSVNYESDNFCFCF